MGSFEMARPQGFALEESANYLTRFRAITAASDRDGLDLAFAIDGSWEPVGLRVCEHGDALRIEILANPEDADELEIQDHVARMLGLSLDFGRYREIGRRDPVVGRLQQENPDVRPVRFPTAWEAGVWALLSQRTRWAQAVAMKRWISETHGFAVVRPDGSTMHGFPGPAAVRGISEVRGLSLQRIEWLHGLADAAMHGKLDCEMLATSTQAEGMMALRGIPGIGPYSAELILARGAANPDIFPMHEPVLHELMTRLYGVAEKERHREIAEAWRPYRSWVMFLIRVGA